MAISAVDLSETFSSIVETTGKSVVRVEGRRRRPTSGVVWSEKQIVTVAHGLEGDRAVVALDGRELDARVVGTDSSTDLALLEVQEALSPAAFDDGAGLKVGQVVLLLARPGETVRATSGIVSALGTRPWRAGRGGGEIDRYLEADAPHQPGFSGGPLVGIEGRVLGITSSGLVRGTSLTIPTTTVRRVLGQLSAHGKVRRSYLGLSMQPVQLPEPVRLATNEEIGLLVVAVEDSGPAAQAGVQYGDTLLHLGDDSVKTLHDLYAFLREDRGGQQVPLKLYRNGQVHTLQVTLGAR
ncbi:MAG: trypsin-like peptidase domain-containing protein [Myxococcota bacterium]